MLNYGADFWPLFFAVIGGAAVLTVLACLLVARFSPAWFRRGHHQPQAGRHLTAVGSDYEARAGGQRGHLPKAA